MLSFFTGGMSLVFDVAAGLREILPCAPYTVIFLMHLPLGSRWKVLVKSISCDF